MLVIFLSFYLFWIKFYLYLCANKRNNKDNEQK
nr:MAG TPA: hypothetical protein [Caudoviricetes sp.]DAX96992.1 MAG TPA: hypothetical protein [Caudoviricetes sp.]